MIIVGIDPGKTGGVAILTPAHIGSGVDVDLFTMPSISELIGRLNLLPDGKPAHVFLEKSQSFPGQGIASAFSYGVHFGELCGVVRTLGLTHTLVVPRMWTKEMHIGTQSAHPKERSLEAVERLFPNIKLQATERSRTPHEGLVDALLIAEWGRRHLLKGPTHG